MFIEIEGIEGVGKTTQCQLLRDWLEDSGFNSIVTKELNSTYFGKAIKKILNLNESENNLREEMFLFLACKTQYYRSVILPNIKNGTSVIGDRGSGSFLSYHYDLFEDVDMLYKMLDLATVESKADITILLDLPIDMTMSRIRRKQQQSKFDRMKASFLERQKNVFISLSEELDNWIIVDSSPSVEDVHHQIKAVVSKHFCMK